MLVSAPGACRRQHGGAMSSGGRGMAMTLRTTNLIGWDTPTIIDVRLNRRCYA
jgi:hypothetical protein